MKRISALALLLAGLALAETSGAVVIVGGTFDGTDAGNVDAFIQEGPQQGNPTEETDWVNDVLSSLDVTVTYQIKDQPVTYYSTDEDGVFAFLLPSPTSDYFLIKKANRIGLFQNLLHLNWGVFDSGLLSSRMNLNGDDFEISHVTRFNADATAVPEPSALTLLGVGLLALGFYRRKR